MYGGVLLTIKVYFFLSPSRVAISFSPFNSVLRPRTVFLSYALSLGRRGAALGRPGGAGK